MAICRCILNLTVASAISIPLVLADDLERASHLIRPVIHARDEDKLAAMRSASVIVLAQIQDIALFSEPREVKKPPEVGGPMVPVIPLCLAKISAKPLVNIRGNGTGLVEFYSWVWASGKHGGARLFNPRPPSVHILFLKDDSGYLHTVGDYPAYDIEIRARWVQEFVANWKSGDSDGAGLMERIVAIRLKAELESLEADEASDYWLNTVDLAAMTSRAFVASQLNWLCYRLVNPIGRAKACAEFAEANRTHRGR